MNGCAVFGLAAARPVPVAPAASSDSRPEQKVSLLSVIVFPHAYVGSVFKHEPAAISRVVVLSAGSHHADECDDERKRFGLSL